MPGVVAEKDFFIDNLLVRIHFIIVLIRCSRISTLIDSLQSGSDFERGSGPLRVVHFPRHKWPGGEGICCPLRLCQCDTRHQLSALYATSVQMSNELVPCSREKHDIRLHGKSSFDG